MPLLNIKTNISIKNKTAFAEAASKATSELLEKSESYVMINIEDNQCLMFAGNHNPCALLSLKSLGLPEDLTTTFSRKLCAFIESQTTIEASRIYIEFSSPERHMWGWDSRTF